MYKIVLYTIKTHNYVSIKNLNDTYIYFIFTEAMLYI